MKGVEQHRNIYANLYMEKYRRYENLLEFNKVLALLKNQAVCIDTQNNIDKIVPSYSFEETDRFLKQTSDAYMLISRYADPPIERMSNVNSALSRAKSGGILTMKELLNIAALLRGFRLLKSWKEQSVDLKTCIDTYFEKILPNKYFEDKLFNAILSEDEISDNASETLYQIRGKLKRASLKVRQQLEKLINSATYKKYLQDPIVTLREGRFVIPVKVEHRYDVKGLVHDTSSSGSTVFIEPLSVVEVNNEIKVLESEEKTEIERILLELSKEAGSFSESIINGYNAVINLDLIFAKAKLAYKMKATLPIINETGIINLKKARHPLISDDIVVPIDIQLGNSFDVLVITGPNTGGKTVSIKTIGLIELMAMSGLMIPADENSEIAIFSKVLVDIGDEQSIEQSLSTFSAHMTNVIEIMEDADSNSLVLLDELGAGTDPIEGAALAMSILESLKNSNSKIAATTHYAELKAYALKTDRVENGCCEFDVNTLKPTYKLLIGVPGSSNAFAISKKLGMDDLVVERAKSFISEDKNEFEHVVEVLEERRIKLEEEYKRANEITMQAKKLKKEAEDRLIKLKKDTKIEIDRAREKADQILSRTTAQANEIMDELKKAKKQKKGLTLESASRLKSQLKKLEAAADPIDEAKSSNYKLPRKLKVGDTVLIFDIDKKGTVLEVEDSSGNVMVQAGIIKTRIPVSNLRLIEEKLKPKVSAGVTRNIKSITEQKSKMEIDLRGYTSLEAIMELDGFIDRALLLGMHEIMVIHGKGTGVLRTEIHKHLKKHPSVKSYRLGVFGEGESGVTVVQLK